MPPRTSRGCSSSRDTPACAPRTSPRRSRTRRDASPPGRLPRRPWSIPWPRSWGRSAASPRTFSLILPPVISRHALFDSVVHPAADRVARVRHHLLHDRLLLLREPPEHPGRVGLPPAHPQAHPRVDGRAQRGLHRLQAVVPAARSVLPDPHAAQREIDVVADDHQLFAPALPELRDHASRLVHVGPGLHEHQLVPSQAPLGGPELEAGLPELPVHLLRERVDRRPADVMPRAFVFLVGIPDAEHDKHSRGYFFSSFLGAASFFSPFASPSTPSSVSLGFLMTSGSTPPTAAAAGVTSSTLCSWTMASSRFSSCAAFRPAARGRSLTVNLTSFFSDVTSTSICSGIASGRHWILIILTY